MSGPEQKAAWNYAAEVKAAHEAQLLALPGVHGVGLGPKKTNGQWVSETPAIVVYTVKKQDVPPELQIPAEIDGVPTDVEERPQPKFAACPPPNATSIDDKSHSPLQGGVRIEVKDVQTFSGVTETNINIGTGGCLARIGTGPLPQRTVVMLTCHHVIVGRCELHTDAGQAVGHPTHYHCSSCSACCTNLFGRAMRIKPELDTAAVALDKDTKWVAEIREAHDNGNGTFSNVAVRGAHTIDVLPLNYQVRKRGMRTGLRHGTVRSVHTTLPMSQFCGPANPIVLPDMIVIDSNSNTDWFACAGDSGSAVLNDSDEVVGIVSIGDGPSAQAVSIGAIIADYAAAGLTLEIASANALNQVQTAPQPVGVPPPQEMSVVALGGFGTMPAAFVVRLTEVRDELTATDNGGKYAAAIERHAQEARDLVNTNKRVATVWRRNGGPEIVHAALAAIQNEEARLPESIGEKSFGECVRRIAAIFTRYASKGFVDDIARFYEDVARLGGTSYAEAKAALA